MAGTVEVNICPSRELSFLLSAEKVFSMLICYKCCSGRDSIFSDGIPRIHSKIMQIATNCNEQQIES